MSVSAKRRRFFAHGRRTDRPERDRGIVTLVFRCHPEGGSEQLSDESTAVEWLTPEEIADRMGEIYAVRLLDAVRGDAAPHVRTHDGRTLIDMPQAS